MTKYSRLGIVKLLIDNNVNINDTNNNGTTALMYSALMLKENIIQELLKYNADINKKDNNGDDVYAYLKSNDYDSNNTKIINNICRILKKYSN